MKIPSYSHYSNQRPSSVSGPHSTPRDVGDDDEVIGRQSSAKTIIPTGENTSISADVASVDKNESSVDKEDRATSDHEDIEENPAQESDSKAEFNPSDDEMDQQERQSVKSDTIVMRSRSARRSVTFLTEDDDV